MLSLPAAAASKGQPVDARARRRRQTANGCACYMYVPHLYAHSTYADGIAKEFDNDDMIQYVCHLTIFSQTADECLFLLQSQEEHTQLWRMEGCHRRELPLYQQMSLSPEPHHTVESQSLYHCCLV
jgi:hypothetical protein